ncbi:MAG: hydrogenase formation protein HypD [Acidobacteria bacterium]|nr:hydrogenase formation protein HypD [Acidobacteriota bacterium]
MEIIDPFENPYAAKRILSEIEILSLKIKNEIKMMEVCGTHTQSISKYGLRRLMPKNVMLISGPGCPVCVTPNSFIERAIALARKGFRIATFGDLLRVPSGNNSLEKEKANGAIIDVVYSPLDALNIAKSTKDEMVFLAVGFETTIPSVCATLKKANDEKIKNFKILSAHKIIPPPLRILASDPQLKIDGFICPGHVSAIIGSKIYDFLPSEFGKGAVVSGFSLVDLLSSIKILLEQKKDNNPSNVNNYKRVVKEEGNLIAKSLIEKFFEMEDAVWRGFGVIKESGLKLRKEWKDFDASLIDVEVKEVKETRGCRCGDVLKGIISPRECPLMGKICNPENPVGACMVSSEGSCAAYYKYERSFDG